VTEVGKSEGDLRPMQYFIFDIRIFHQPSHDHLSFKPPLIAHLECWQFPLGYQTVDGKFVNFQVLGDLVHS